MKHNLANKYFSASQVDTLQHKNKKNAVTFWVFSCFLPVWLFYAFYILASILLLPFRKHCWCILSLHQEFHLFVWNSVSDLFSFPQSPKHFFSQCNVNVLDRQPQQQPNQLCGCGLRGRFHIYSSHWVTSAWGSVSQRVAGRVIGFLPLLTSGFGRRHYHAFIYNILISWRWMQVMLGRLQKTTAPDTQSVQLRLSSVLVLQKDNQVSLQEVLHV